MSLYSVRMRASFNEAHVSGSERLVDGRFLETVLPELIFRALNSYISPDQICVTVDTIAPASVTCIRSLDVRTTTSSSHVQAIVFSKQLLETNGVSGTAIERAFNLLQSGPSPEGNVMRGAIIMDAATGERIEPDTRRGVRVSRIDYTEDARRLIEDKLRGWGMYHERTVDALAIATKVSHRKESMAELCWSDDPGYTTGYVASRQSGYVRITHIKEMGSLKGGRVFFVDREGLSSDVLSIEKYIDYLERQPVMIDRAGEIYAP